MMVVLNRRKIKIKLNRRPPLCACGCEERVKWNKEKKCWNRFINHHSNRNKPMSQEQKDKIKLSNIKYFSIQENRNKASIIAKEIASRPEIKKRKSEIKKEYYTIEGNREKQAISNKEVSNRPEVRKRNIETKLQYYSIPENKEKQDLFLKEMRSRPEVIKKKKESINKFYSIKENVEKASISAKIAMNKPEVKAKHKEAMNRPEVKAKFSGENGGGWQGGKSFELYTEDWTNTLKESIRQRDNYGCQLCDIEQNKLDKRLDVHHIDYNKENCNPVNLISLCHSCHTKTNYNRENWISYFISLMESKDVDFSSTKRDLKTSDVVSGQTRIRVLNW